ncbi:hypothetical protein EBR96_00765 [bacterium]|nr:hypothetical protein [bacterium]
MGIGSFLNLNSESFVEKGEASRLRTQLGTVGTIEFIPAAEDGNWFYVHRDTPIELAKIPSKKRYEVNRGLKNCVVRRLTADEFRRLGAAEVAESCWTRRGQSFSQAEFFRTVDVYGKYPDIIHLWGVFFEDQMTGFAVNYILPGSICYFNQIDFCPKFLNKQSSYALVFVMSNYYLESGYTINAGFRRIYHPTEFQEYLVSKFGFEKKAIRMRFTSHFILDLLRWPVLLVTRLARINSGKLGGLATLYKARVGR